MNNIFHSVPDEIEEEIFELLLNTKNCRVERILSKGHSSPPTGWYDQAENEWVILLQGAGTVVFENGREVSLKTGDYLNIPAHAKHKVSWTDPDLVTVWLAVFYQ